ncbi:UNVERIFIED_CONTAM: preprotein translocase subunit SecF [Acetivibrio alkalicellulosi]
MFDFFSKRNYFFILSGLIIVTGIIGLIYNGGFVLDIQFQGGTVIQIEMNDDTFDIQRAEEVASSAVDKRIIAQKSHTLDTTDNRRIDFLIVSVATKEDLNDDERRAVISALREEFDIKEDAEMRFGSYSPSIGRELQQRGITAVIIASILMLLYIWIRFNIMSGLFAGLTAIVALVHDVAVMLSVYTIFGIPLNESFIAAVLTIVGYSMNDTIVIYDRIRENTKISRKDTVEGLVNKSITQSLKRSINTSITTLTCVVTVYVLASINGIGSIKEFSFPLIIGLASGTYSSIFIASPLWVMWKKSQQKKTISNKPAKA